MKKLILFAFALIVPSLAFADTLVISESQGSAVIVRGEQTLPISKGTVCQVGDKIQTANEGFVDLAMNDLAGCRVLASSDIAIEQGSSKDMGLTLVKGNIILNLNELPKDSSFRVETPTAIAAVRGTQFWGRVNPEIPENPVTTFAVRKGRVEIKTKLAAETFLLETGQALDIPRDGTSPVAMRTALDAEMGAMAQADEIKTGS